MARALRRYSWPVAVAVLVVVLGGLAVSGLDASPTRANRPVVLASGSWEPFVGPDLPGGGPLARIVAEALQRQGLDLELRFSSWDLAEERTARGEAFGSFPWVGSASRRDDFLLSEPLFEFRYALFYSRDTFPEPPRIEDADDLEELDVGIVKGYDVWDELDAAVDEFIVFGTAEEAFDALAAGSIDLLPEGLLPGSAIVEERAPRVQVVEQGTDRLLGASEELFFMMPRTAEAAELLPQFNEALRSVKATQLYADAEAALSTDDDVVELGPLDVDHLVELFDAPDAAADRLLAPRGTTARVLDWPDAFTTGHSGPSSDPVYVEVRVLDGPARGRIVFVDARAIRLTGTGG